MKYVNNTTPLHLHIMELERRRDERNAKRAHRLKWLNRCLIPVCILMLAGALRAIVHYGMPAAIAACSVATLFVIFVWRTK